VATYLKYTQFTWHGELRELILGFGDVLGTCPIAE
jgi:hypothetical protein